MSKQKVSNRKVCKGCSKELALTRFYTTKSKMYPSGRLDLCKQCIKDMIDIDDVKSFKDILRQIDKPFLGYLWAKCLENKEAEDPVGAYFRQTATLMQYKDMTWADSDMAEVPPNSRQQVRDTEKPDAESKTKDQVQVPDHLIVKWGRMFKPEEILEFEATYQRLVKNYEIKTAQHDEFLMQACIYQVKSRIAIATNDINGAKHYSDMFNKATQAGKLQPAQLSQADLSGGLDNFSALVRRVEESEDIIPILPEYRLRPRDLPDVVIWAYINYTRNLTGLEEVSYEEVYRWYDQRKDSYEASLASGIGQDLDDGDSDG